MDTQAKKEASVEQKIVAEQKQAKKTTADAKARGIDIPQEIRECVGKRILINEVTKTASIASEYNYEILLENMAMSHGAKNIRLFTCTEDNLPELVTICQKYKNGIVKE